MITNKGLSVDDPINIKKDINLLLLRDINYSEEQISADLKSRNVDYFIENKKVNAFNDIVVNDCIKKETSNDYNYDDLILKIQPQTSDEPEDIKTLIQNITDDIVEISEKINQKNASIYSIWSEIKSDLAQFDKDLITKSNQMINVFIEYQKNLQKNFDF
jgi:hypothetical protein